MTRNFSLYLPFSRFTRREKVLQARLLKIFNIKETFSYVTFILLTKNRQVNKPISYFPFYMIILVLPYHHILHNYYDDDVSIHVPVLPRAPPDSDKELRCVAEGESVTS